MDDDTPRRPNRKKLKPNEIQDLMNQSFVQYDEDSCTDSGSDFSVHNSEVSSESDENNNISESDQEDLVADSGRPDSGDEDEVMPGVGAGAGDGQHTIWHDFQGKQKNFPYIGDQNIILPFDPETASDLDYLKLFWTEDMIAYIVLQTNKNADQVLSSIRVKKKSRYSNWTPTDNAEVKKYLAIRLWMGLVPLPKYSDYWSKKLIYQNFVAKTNMTRDRFQLLTRFLHFSDNNEKDKGRLHKIQPLITIIESKFKEVRKPGKKLAVDESMVPWRGRLVFRQYLPNKSHKYGIKLFKVCDEHGYTYGMIIYSGKGTVILNKGVSMPTQVVKELVKDYLGVGRVICTDNYYTSIELCRFLLENDTHFVGTVRKNRRGLPKLVVSAKLKKKGEIKAQENDDGVLVVKWKDQREVLLLSSLYGPKDVLTGKRNRDGEPLKKPEIVVEYNRAKGGIDISDTLKSYHCIERKTIRWYRKVADDLLFGTCIVNALLLKVQATGKSVSLQGFRENIVQSLLEIPEDPIQRTPNPSNHYLKNSKDLEGKDEKETTVQNVLSAVKKRGCGFRRGVEELQASFDVLRYLSRHAFSLCRLFREVPQEKISQLIG